MWISGSDIDLYLMQTYRLINGSNIYPQKNKQTLNIEMKRSIITILHTKKNEAKFRPQKKCKK